MDTAYHQYTHKSTPNLNHLSLAPLTTRLPLRDDHGYDLARAELVPPHRSSYLQGNSTPTTPSILSRNPSAIRLHRSTQHQQGQSSDHNTTIPKSKSSSYLLYPPPSSSSSSSSQPHARPQPLKPLRPRHPDRRQSSQKRRSSTEWILRTGAALSSEARESKGQSWLASRASSTSLLSREDDDDHDHDDLDLDHDDHDDHHDLGTQATGRRGGSDTWGYSGGAPRGGLDDLSFFADDECSPLSTRASRGASRLGSRVELRTPPLSGGARTPRRGSRGGDGGGGGGGGGGRGGGTGGSGLENVVVDDDEYAAGPDFVGGLEDMDMDMDGDDDDDEGSDAEREVSRFTVPGSDLLGDWVDRFLGWTLFSGEDEGEGDEEATPGGGNGSGSAMTMATKERRPLAAEEEAKDASSSSSSKKAAAAAAASEDGWQDAAWLLSVATRTLL